MSVDYDDRLMDDWTNNEQEHNLDRQGEVYSDEVNKG